MMKKKKITGQIRQISSMTSTSSSSDVNMDGKTVRQKSWDYKPSNRYADEMINERNEAFGRRGNKFAVKFFKRVETEVLNKNYERLKSRSLYSNTGAYSSHEFLPGTEPSPKPKKFGQSTSNSKKERSGKRNSNGYRLPKIGFQDFGYIRTSTEDPFRESETKERMFQIITNDRVMMKFYPMQLDSPYWILEFLETYLDMKKI